MLPKVLGQNSMFQCLNLILVPWRWLSRLLYWTTINSSSTKFCITRVFYVQYADGDERWMSYSKDLFDCEAYEAYCKTCHELCFVYTPWPTPGNFAAKLTKSLSQSYMLVILFTLIYEPSVSVGIMVLEKVPSRQFYRMKMRTPTCSNAK